MWWECKNCKKGSFHAGAPVEWLHLDILGPFTPSSSGNQYILMLVCQFTKWMEVYGILDQTTEQVAEVVVKNFISRFGCPSLIHTDQGSNFTSSLFQAICDLLEITKTRTTPYRPCSNGQVEDYNRTLLQIIRCYLDEKIASSDKDLEILTGAIRSLPNRQTGFTPNMMMFGREVSQPVELMFGSTVHEGTSEPEYLCDLRHRLQKVHALARDKIKESQKCQKKYYDASHLQHEHDAGDIVLKLNKKTKNGQPSKLQPIWMGPFLVIDVISPILLRIRDRRKSMVVHHDMVKLCNDRHLPLWMQRMRSKILGQGHSDSASVSTDIDQAPLSDSVSTDNVGCDSDDLGISSLFKDDRSLLSQSRDWRDIDWIQCEDCGKWRAVPKQVAEDYANSVWCCSLNGDLLFDSCDNPEEEFSEW